MQRIKKSVLFMRQWHSAARFYKERAGNDIAERFIVAVEEALRFIQQNPYACPLYDVGRGYEDLLVYQFRKWSLSGFPYLILFRLDENATILIEVLYAQKINIPSRLATDLGH